MSIDLTILLRIYSRRRRAELQHLSERSFVSAKQEEILRSLLNRARTTRFGKDHNFPAIADSGSDLIKSYQDQVPLRRYEDFWQQYWKTSFPILLDATWPGRIPYFALSSGTTSGSTKYLPYTQEIIQSTNRAGLDLLIHHLSARPNSRLLSGKSLVLGGSTDLKILAEGVMAGDMSGIAAETLPWWAKHYTLPPKEIALLSNWEEKLSRIAKLALKTNITSLSGVPSWLLLLFEKLNQTRSIAGNDGRKASAKEQANSWSDFFPQLELLIHGGVNFAPYHDQFRELLHGGHAELREVYPASEGFIASADRDPGQGLRINLDHDLFYEFIPLDELEQSAPTRHWIENVELGVNYAIAITSPAGLWSYLLGDTVRFVDLAPHRILVTGRTSQYLSAFGEHIIPEELELAVAAAARHTQLQVSDFVVGANIPKRSGELGRHCFFVEASPIPIESKVAKSFSLRIDQELSRINEDYAAHRAGGFGMGSPEVIFVPPGTFAAWLKSHGKLGGQHKVPRVILQQGFLNELRAFVMQRR